jgi:ElaB/YqjD/DUF883 family membrane-anchored ribosome-binding protein
VLENADAPPKVPAEAELSNQATPPGWEAGVKRPSNSGVPPSGLTETAMTQQKADYPLDYSKTANGMHEASAADAPRDSVRNMAEGAGDRLKSAADTAQEIAGRAAEQARNYGEKAQEAARNFKPYVENSMKEQPMATLAVAAIIGFALGALWKK